MGSSGSKNVSTYIHWCIKIQKTELEKISKFKIVKRSNSMPLLDTNMTEIKQTCIYSDAFNNVSLDVSIPNFRVFYSKHGFYT